MDFPITAEAMLTVAGVAFFGSALTNWLKMYIKRGLLVNGLCLVLCMVFALIAQFINAAWHPTDSMLYSAFLVGFWGASLATFGYETVKNLRDWVSV